MINKCIVWVKTWCSTSCTLKIDHLIADVVCIFVFVQILMWATWCWCWWWRLWEIKKTVYLIKLPPCPGQPHWPGSDHWTPSPQSFHLPMCVAAGSPLSWSHHLSPHWARVTSTKSHFELHLPSAGDQLSELDHYGRWNCCSFTRDYIAIMKEYGLLDFHMSSLHFDL